MILKNRGSLLRRAFDSLSNGVDKVISGSRPSAYAELRLEGSRFVMTAYDVAETVSIRLCL